MTGPDTLTGSGDVLRAGSERSPFTHRVRAASKRHRLLLVVVVLALVAAVAADQWQQRREMQALLDQVAASEQSIDAADGGLRVIVDYYSPVVFRADAPESVKAGFRSDLAAAAAQAQVRTRAEAAAVASVRILPWHRALRQARQTYQERVDGWSAYLATVASQPGSLFGAANDVLAPTKPARETLLDATPWWDAASRQRIDALLAP